VVVVAPHKDCSKSKVRKSSHENEAVLRDALLNGSERALAVLAEFCYTAGAVLHDTFVNRNKRFCCAFSR